MKPLSSTKYFWQNKKRASTVFVVVMLSVAVVSFLTSLITSIVIDSSKSNLDVLTHVSYITPASPSVMIDDETANKTKSFTGVANIYDVSINYTMLNTIVGNTSSPIFVPKNTNDIKALMNAMNLTLKDGVLPSNNGYEIILNVRLLSNKHLKIGDYIGDEVNSDEWLSGKYKIVGSFTGDSIVSFANNNTRLDGLIKNGLNITKPTGQLFVPKSGKLSEVNSQIESITKLGISKTTYNTMKHDFDTQLKSLNNVLFMIIFVVVLIVSISIGAMIFIVYMNRSEEFGILHAIGYRKSFINKMILKELATLSVFCWAFGYLFSFLLIELFNMIIFNPKGQELYFYSQAGLLNTLIIPIMVLTCAAFPIFRKLKKWDPIAVIERRD